MKRGRVVDVYAVVIELEDIGVRGRRSEEGREIRWIWI